MSSSSSTKSSPSPISSSTIHSNPTQSRSITSTNNATPTSNSWLFTGSMQSTDSFSDTKKSTFRSESSTNSITAGKSSSLSNSNPTGTTSTTESSNSQTTAYSSDNLGQTTKIKSGAPGLLNSLYSQIGSGPTNNEQTSKDVLSNSALPTYSSRFSNSEHVGSSLQQPTSSASLSISTSNLQSSHESSSTTSVANSRPITHSSIAAIELSSSTLNPSKSSPFVSRTTNGVTTSSVPNTGKSSGQSLGLPSNFDSTVSNTPTKSATKRESFTSATPNALRSSSTTSKKSSLGTADTPDSTNETSEELTTTSGSSTKSLTNSNPSRSSSPTTDAPTSRTSVDTSNESLSHPYVSSIFPSKTSNEIGPSPTYSITKTSSPTSSYVLTAPTFSNRDSSKWDPGTSVLSSSSPETPASVPQGIFGSFSNRIQSSNTAYSKTISETNTLSSSSKTSSTGKPSRLVPNSSSSQEKESSSGQPNVLTQSMKSSEVARTSPSKISRTDHGITGSSSMGTYSGQSVKSTEASTNSDLSSDTRLTVSSSSTFQINQSPDSIGSGVNTNPISATSGSQVKPTTSVELPSSTSNLESLSSFHNPTVNSLSSRISSSDTAVQHTGSRTSLSSSSGVFLSSKLSNLASTSSTTSSMAISPKSLSEISISGNYESSAVRSDTMVETSQSLKSGSIMTPSSLSSKFSSRPTSFSRIYSSSEASSIFGTQFTSTPVPSSSRMSNFESNTSLKSTLAITGKTSSNTVSSSSTGGKPSSVSDFTTKGTGTQSSKSILTTTKPSSEILSSSEISGQGTETASFKSTSFPSQISSTLVSHTESSSSPSKNETSDQSTDPRVSATVTDISSALSGGTDSVSSLVSLNTITRADSSAPSVTASPAESDTNWLPYSIIIQSTHSTSSSPSFNPNVTATLPHAIAPQTPVSEPPDSSTITIGFKRQINYNFLVNNPLSSAQIFAFLPDVLVYPFNYNQHAEKATHTNVSLQNKRERTTLLPYRDAILDKKRRTQVINPSDVQMIQIMPMLSRDRSYLVSLAELYFPARYVDKLKDYMKDPDSRLYNNSNPTLFALADLIDPSIPLTGVLDANGNVNGGTPGDDSSGSGNHASQSGLSQQNGNNNDGSLETANSTKHITGVITKRLAIFLNCFAFGILLWILSFLVIFKKFHKVDPIEEGESYSEFDTTGDIFKHSSLPGDNASGSISGPEIANEKLPNNTLEEPQTNNRNAIPGLENPNEDSDVNLISPLSDDLVVTGESTVYSTLHGLEYFVDDEGQFHYAGNRQLSGESGTTKGEKGESDNLDNYMYTGSEEISMPVSEAPELDMNGMEVDEEGNFVLMNNEIYDNLENSRSGSGNNNSDTVESYNNNHLYKMTRNSDTEKFTGNGLSSNNEGSAEIHEFDTGVGGEYVVPDLTQNHYSLEPVTGYDEYYAAPYTIRSSAEDTSNNGLTDLPLDFDEYMYQEDDSDVPYISDFDDVRIEDIDDGKVDDLQIDDFDDLDEEMYQRLSKLMIERSMARSKTTDRSMMGKQENFKKTNVSPMVFSSPATVASTNTTDMMNAKHVLDNCASATDAVKKFPERSIQGANTSMVGSIKSKSKRKLSSSESRKLTISAPLESRNSLGWH
ncbi:hypothetical protein ZYGM_003234 [Zygosaccharomyces mellis]|uniref:Uncharacterized protein n=1 Tax=Zygosaccharomyces mellis TaxID=42258 RepID=A0A4C2E768_9SACH|nr:hypothetical protein ZYGM_003234 [Zygosaccharomyces mellis]